MKALYIGSFDPFTNGHLDIIKQAEQIFDEVLIVVARNSKKKRAYSESLCINAIKPYLGKNTKIGIGWESDTAPELAKVNYCDYIIRGLRNTSDWLYEEQLYEMYKMIDPEIKIIYLRSNSSVSSTFVRDLLDRKMDVTKYIPYDIKQLSDWTVKFNNN